jgi:hypothetical protein
MNPSSTGFKAFEVIICRENIVRTALADAMSCPQVYWLMPMIRKDDIVEAWYR